LVAGKFTLAQGFRDTDRLATAARSSESALRHRTVTYQ
jgi:hypothetical protein